MADSNNHDTSASAAKGSSRHATPHPTHGASAEARLDDEPEPPDSGFRGGQQEHKQGHLKDESSDSAHGCYEHVEQRAPTPDRGRDFNATLSTRSSRNSSISSASTPSLTGSPYESFKATQRHGDATQHVAVYPVGQSEDSVRAAVTIDLGAPTATEGEAHLHRPHTLTSSTCLSAFKSNIEAGLSDVDAKTRLEADGLNRIGEAKGVNVWEILLKQVANALTIILLAAMALSFGVHDWVEGGVVAAVIAVNVIIGFVQEYKAENALASLRSLSSPMATVLRDGEKCEIDAAEIVCGDIVHFKTGDVVPADIRLVSLTSLEIDEAPLTGESVPVLKTLEALSDAHGTMAPADRTNMSYAGTTVTKGRGAGVIVATGMDTQIGLIAAALDKKKGKSSLLKADGSPAPLWRRMWEPVAKLLGLRDGTPLQRKLSQFAIILLGLAILCAIIVFSVAEFRLDDDVILYAIALGIGVLPESLVAVLTITFSVGAKRMAKANVIVRKLEALEALGGVTDICSDKTGTLTYGKMIVNKVWTPDGGVQGRTYSVEKGGASVLEPLGNLIDSENNVVQAYSPETTALSTVACLCNVAEINFNSETKEWTSRGDPTEVALRVFASKMGLDHKAMSQIDYIFEQEHAFDSTTKRMTTMYRRQQDRSDSKKYLFMKGAPERVLECCSTYKAQANDAIHSHFDKAAQQAVLDQMEILASQGLRVLAFAERSVDADLVRKKQKKHRDDTEQEVLKGQLPRADAEQDFHFVGLCGLYDPPRSETLGSVRECQRAGIVVRMITGDHVATARAIAREVGILDGTEPASAVMSASDFDALSESEVDALPMMPLVVARCSPATKVRMIAAGHRRSRLLAMTGDGINDAPALVKAPIGIAMGSGTDVAKDSAELILTDDKFDNIAKAVKEGRTVFKNIQRFMIALLVLNVAEVLLLLIGLALRDRAEESLFPISPIGVLFLNLVAGLPAIGLGFEGAEPNVMRRSPHDLRGGVLSRQVVTDLFVYGLTMGWTCLVVFVVMIYGFGNGVLGMDCNEGGALCSPVFEARSATFTALFLQGLFVPWHLVSMEESLLCVNPVQRLWSNQFLLWSVLFGVVTIPICVYVPVWNTDVFRQGPLGGRGWGMALAALAVFWATLEAWKWAARRNHWPWLTRISGGGAFQNARPDDEETPVVAAVVKDEGTNARG